MPVAQKSSQEKAEKIYEIPNVTHKDILVSPGDPFYVNLSSLRTEKNGSFEKHLCNRLQIDGDYKFLGKPSSHSVRLSIMGFRGCGKTTFLNAVRKRMQEGGDYFPVFCDVQKELSDNPQAIDFVILQMKRLLEQIESTEGLAEDSILKEGAEVLASWLTTRVQQTETTVGTGVNAESGVFAGIGFLLKLTSSLTAKLSVASENSEIIRKELKNTYSDFALKINEFVEVVTKALEKSGKGKKIIFIVDGIEKLDADHKLIDDIQQKYERIRADVIFSFPIEATFDRDRFHDLRPILFPFIRVKNPQGELIKQTVVVFKDLLEKRVASSLFASEEAKEKLVEYSGGSVRQLFTLLEESSFQLEDRENGTISVETVESAIQYKASLYVRNIRLPVWEKFKEIEAGVKMRKEEKPCQINVDPALVEMVIKNLVFDYNDGTAYETNPIIAQSPIYKQMVSGQ